MMQPNQLADEIKLLFGASFQQNPNPVPTAGTLPHSDSYSLYFNDFPFPIRECQNDQIGLRRQVGLQEQAVLAHVPDDAHVHIERPPIGIDRRASNRHADRNSGMATLFQSEG
jgi:hypothetical protein